MDFITSAFRIKACFEIHTFGGIPELVSLQTGFKILHETKSGCQKISETGQFCVVGSNLFRNFSSSFQECVCINVHITKVIKIRCM